MTDEEEKVFEQLKIGDIIELRTTGLQNLFESTVRVKILRKFKNGLQEGFVHYSIPFAGCPIDSIQEITKNIILE